MTINVLEKSEFMTVTGTSFATPCFSGSAALFLQAWEMKRRSKQMAERGDYKEFQKIVSTAF
jgi:subtilisin family serine protease